MNIHIRNVNWLAVFVAAIVVMVIGGVWYQALFGELWAELHGYSEADIARMQERMPPQVFFPIMFAAYLVMSFAIALLLSGLESKNLQKGLLVGGVAWLIAAAIGMTSHITSDQHIGIYAIDTTYQLVIFLTAGALHGIWRTDR